MLKVRIYGDSLGLPRIGYVINSERYVSLIENYFRKKDVELELLDRTRINSTVTYLYKWYLEDKAYFGEKGDILIIHCGICDCAPRPIPPAVRNYISRLKGRLQKILIKLIKNNRALLQKNNFIWRVTEPTVFEETYQTWFKDAVNHFKHIFIINIAPTNETTEKHSPGLTKSINQYNEMINALKSLSQAESKVHFVDIHDVIKKNYEVIDEYILKEDGHHITPKTHAIIYQSIIEKLQN